jgi:hypothetical protein
MKLSDAEKVRLAGARMSNWLYNMGQRQGRFDACERVTMREMVEDWDAVVKLLPRPKRKKR